MAVPYVFANATSAIPLSNLDNNFSTPVTIGNVAIQLGNTATTLSNLSLANVTITSSSIAVGSTANAVVYANTTNALVTNSNLTFNGTTFTTANDASIHGITVGLGAGSISTNTAVGTSALVANGAGLQNTAVGNVALTTNGAGSYNSAFGFGALNVNSSGSYNTAIGNTALVNTTASNNTAVGYQAGYTNTSYSYNTFLGYQAGYYANGGTYNCFVGLGSGYFVTTGTKNTILGAYNGNQGGLDIRTASNYVVLSDGDGNPRLVGNNVGDIITGGYGGAGLSNVNGVTLNNNGNSYAIVNHASGVTTGTYFAAFGYNGSAIGSITQSGTTAVLFNVTSDQRLKENIVDAPEFSNVIDSIKVRSFDWITDQTHQRAGFIAQELVTVAPEAVHQPADPEEMMAVDYSKLVPMLVKEIQSLRKRLAALEGQA